MSKGDLQRYGIRNDGDYAVYHYVDATGKNEEETRAIVEEAAQKLKVPTGKYMIVVGGSKTPDNLLIGKQCGAYNLPTPEWLPNHHSRKTAKVIYSSGYNKERVEKEAEQNGQAINRFLAD